MRKLLRFCGLAAISIGLMVWAAACQARPAPPPPTPQPAPTTLTVYLDAELDPLRPTLAACASEMEGVGLIVFSKSGPVDVVEGDEVSIFIGYAQSPRDQHFYLLGEEEIVAVGAHNGPFDRLTSEELRSLFSESEDLEIWVPLDGTAAKAALLKLMDGMKFHHDAFTASGPRDVLNAIAVNPMAVGVIPAGWLHESARPLLSLTRYPILAATNGEAEGRMRELLRCLSEIQD